MDEPGTTYSKCLQSSKSSSSSEVQMIALLGLYFYKLQAIDVRELKNNAHKSGIQRKKEENIQEPSLYTILPTSPA